MTELNPADATVNRAIAFVIDAFLFGIANTMIYAIFFVLGPLIGGLLGIGGMAAASGAESAAVSGGVSILAILVSAVLAFTKWGLMFAVIMGYFVFLQRSDGQTIGKSIMDVKVVTTDGAVPSQRQLVKRTAILYAPFALVFLGLLVTFIPIVGGIIGLVFDPLAFFMISAWVLVELVILFVRDGVRLGDQFADTRVVEA